jgi:hypothetical protein
LVYGYPVPAQDTHRAPGDARLELEYEFEDGSAGTWMRLAVGLVLTVTAALFVAPPAIAALVLAGALR